MGFSLILYKVFMSIWERSTRSRFTIGTLVIFAVAFVWTVFRMYALAWLTEFTDMWDEFGGWYFSSIFIFLCWTGLFHGIRYYELLQKEHKILLSAEAETRREHVKRLQAQSVARDAQLKMLRYQLNPHFLCNTLNAINSLIEINESEKAQQMTVQLSQFLRHSLDNNPDTKITLADEINALNLYLEIEKTRFAERLAVDFQVEEVASEALVPSLLLQPIIENSMKYAIAKSEEGGKISLRAFVDKRTLHIEITDTGPDEKVMEALNTKKESRGVGLSNITQRLQTLYGHQGRIAQFNLSAGGMETQIMLPFEVAEAPNKVVNL
ncbi:sensor histidine kinase [Alteromonas sediminis]|uniref:Sensor histidine kinase n=1 Tax=Alteromonas sediminis TaxID=2259342 RepID=A0A3N5Y999_9ALTE|nr:sensor histidine kinase [Alteromonas sediminis]